jgi:hypothetical protein
VFGRTRTIGLGLAAHARAAGELAQPRRRFVGLEALGKPRSSIRIGLASLALHALVIGLASWLTRADRAPARDALKQPRAPVAVTMLYVAPTEAPSRPRPQVSQPPIPPAAPKAPPAPAPETPLPATTLARNAPEHDEPAATAPEQSSLPEQADRAEPEDPMVSEARRIFRPKRTDLANAVGPVQPGRPVRSWAGGVRCPWGGAPIGGDETPATGVVEGIVRSESDGSPVAGALLQLLGTGSSTFSDDAGHYRLTFDPNLVDRCRSQVVRVSAPGYRVRSMVLAYGASSDNTVEMGVR